MSMRLREYKFLIVALIIHVVILIGVGSSITRNFATYIIKTQSSLLAFANEKEVKNNWQEMFLELVQGQLLLFTYAEKNRVLEQSMESSSTYDLIIQSEGRDEYTAEEEDTLPDVMQQQVTEAEQGLLDENNKIKMQEAEQENSRFIERSEKTFQYDYEKLNDFNYLVEQFYAIDKTTLTDESQLNINALTQKDMKLQTTNDLPQILIYHTHSQEGFVDSVPGDKSMTVMGAGEKLAEILREKYGYNVIHDQGEYDVANRDYAYSVSAPAIETILRENPSIEVIIDLHRDGISGDRKLVMDLDGRPTAQFMFFNGLSRTKDRGNIDYLPNPYINDNLSFAFQMQLKCNEYYPGIARRIYLKGYRYNMHYRPKSLLIELGAQTNTVEEIFNALDPIAHALHLVLE